MKIGQNKDLVFYKKHCHSGSVPAFVPNGRAIYIQNMLTRKYNKGVTYRYLSEQRNKIKCLNPNIPML